MDITPLIEGLRRDLVTATEAYSAEVREAAERLLFGLDPAVRLTLMDALTQAADEISTELDGTSVEVRLKGREPVFVVSTTRPQEPEPVPGSETASEADDDGPLARITLRIPESLKNRIEEAAGNEGVSLNTWLVNAARIAASAGVHISFGRGFPQPPGPPNPPFNPRGKRIQGWVR
jgi:hypothetical protein